MTAQPIFVHEYTLPAQFAGRTEYLSRLISIGQGNGDPETRKRPSVIAVRGIGGIGKSCLLREFVNNIQFASRYSRIVWYSLYLSRSEDVIEAFRAILKALSVSLDGAGPGGLATARRLGELLRHELVRLPTMLVLDGVEVIQCDDPNSPQLGRISPAFDEVQRLLEYACAQSTSTLFLSTRLRVTDLEGLTSYLEMPLDNFSLEEGVQLLRALGVRGQKKALEQCVSACDGHALSLVATGKYLQWKGIPATKMESLMGDIEIFTRSPEGQKIQRLLAKYRASLTPQQQYFLVMLSVHARAVTATDFPALVKNYSGRDEQVWKQIVAPLDALGLLEVYDNGSTKEINAHPLIKLAASTWADVSDKRTAHRNWAEAATRRPFDLILANARELSELQPALTAVEHYLEADDYRQAWRLYSSYLEDPLYQLGYARIQAAILTRFDKAIRAGRYNAGDNGFSVKIGLVMAYGQLGKSEDALGLLKLITEELPKFAEKVKWTKKEYKDRDKLNREFLARDYLSLGRVAEARNVRAKGPHITGLFQLHSGDYSPAIATFERVLPKWLRERGEHEVNNISAWLAESLTRSGSPEKALTVLAPRELLSGQRHLHCCLPSILASSVHASVRLGNVKQARALEDRRMQLERETERPAEESLDLLLEEGRYEEAMGGTVDKLSTRAEDKLDKADEVHALIVRARAWHFLGDDIRAREELASAEDLMDRFSFYRYTDDLKLTSRLLGRGL